MPEDRRKDLLDGQSVPLEFRLRPARSTDALAIDQWQDEPYRQQLKAIRERIQIEPGECYLVEATAGKKTMVVGAFVLSSTMLEYFYLEQANRSQALLLLALDTLIDRFFQRTGSKELLAATPSSPEIEGLLSAFGFEKKALGFGVNRWTLAQASWQSSAKKPGRGG